MAKNKAKKCGVCGVICSDTVYARKWGGDTYYYCHRCHGVDKKAKQRSAYEDSKRFNVKTKPDIYQACEKCGGQKAKKPFKVCFTCRFNGVCEGCGSNFKKPHAKATLCHDCYGRQKAAEEKLEMGLDRNLSKD